MAKTSHDWIKDGEPFTEAPSGMYGFIYEILYTDGKKYIGKKSFQSKLDLPELKTDKVREGFVRKRIKRVHRRTDGSVITKKAEKKGVKARNEVFDVVLRESNWKAYTGSSEQSKGRTIESKTILLLCPTIKSSTYQEAKALFCTGAIEKEEYLNQNILGKFYEGELL